MPAPSGCQLPQIFMDTQLPFIRIAGHPLMRTLLSDLQQFLLSSLVDRQRPCRPWHWVWAHLTILPGSWIALCLYFFSCSGVPGLVVKRRQSAVLTALAWVPLPAAGMHARGGFL